MRSWRSPVLVLALVIVDVVVIAAAIALSRPDPTPPAEVALPPGVGSASPADPVGPTIGAPLFLAGGDDGALARAVRGTCRAERGDPAVVWVGRAGDLSRVRVPGLAEVLGMTWREGRIVLAGADDACAVRGFESTDLGRTWEETDRASVWHMDLDRTNTVVLDPDGLERQVTCVPTSVQGFAGDAALATCGESVVQLGSGPRDVEVFSTPGVGAALPEAQRVLYLGTDGACSVAARPTASGAPQLVSSCIAEGKAPLGLARSGGRLYAQVGVDLYVSADGGRTFQPTGA